MESAPIPSPRIPSSEVCRLAGYGPVTLRRRVKAGRMPKPVDKGAENLYDRAAVYQALGIAEERGQHVEETGRSESPWGKATHALAERRAARLHGHKETA